MKITIWVGPWGPRESFKSKGREMKTRTLTRVLLVVLTTVGTSLTTMAEGKRKPQWYCDPKSKRCVAVEGVNTTSYLPIGLKRAWVFFYEYPFFPHETLSAAFADLASCKVGRKAVDEPTKCRELNAEETLKMLHGNHGGPG